MDSQQRCTEAIRTLEISYDVEAKLTRSYNDIKWDIIDVLSVIAPSDDLLMYTRVGIVVNEDLYFAVDVMYEDPKSVVILAIDEIELDLFLDFINQNQYIKTWNTDTKT